MTRRQLYSLFLCSLAVWTAGNGLVPLLPVYARQLGADPATAGYYLAFSYAALAVGALAAGWVSDRLQRRKAPVVVAGLATVPITWLMGRVGNIWALSALTAALWFCGGLTLALLGILTGLSAGEGERGKIFGIISLASGLGSLVGGLGTGFVADRWGFPAMFTAVAVWVVIWPLAGIALAEKELKRAPGESVRAGPGSGLGGSYPYLLAASLVAAIAGFVIVLGRSLLMSGLGFGAMAIATTGAVGGIVAMPVPPLVGRLSDRVGRKRFLYLAYLAGMASLALLTVAKSLWQFCLVLALQGVFMAVNAVVGNALVTDLVPRESLGRRLSLFGAMPWIGGIVGFAGAGYALQRLGTLPTFLIGIGLVAMAMVLLIPIRGPDTSCPPYQGG